MISIWMGSYHVIDVSRLAVILIDVLNDLLTRVLKSAVDYVNVDEVVNLVAKWDRVSALRGLNVEKIDLKEIGQVSSLSTCTLQGESSRDNAPPVVARGFSSQYELESKTSDIEERAFR